MEKNSALILARVQNFAPISADFAGDAQDDVAISSCGLQGNIIEGLTNKMKLIFLFITTMQTLDLFKSRCFNIVKIGDGNEYKKFK